jgi:hypothetical protein
MSPKSIAEYFALIWLAKRLKFYKNNKTTLFISYDNWPKDHPPFISYMNTVPNLTYQWSNSTINSLKTLGHI